MNGNGGRAICENRVRELREGRLMTQAQLAHKAKLALRTIHNVEKGLGCRVDTMRKILLALELRFDDRDQVFPPVPRYAALAPQELFGASPRVGREAPLARLQSAAVSRSPGEILGRVPPR